MSVDGVSNSGRSKNDVKDTADERERELIARHRREMADLQKKHQKAVAHLKQEYDDAMNGLRENMRQQMSDREKRHISDIQEIQDMNRKRMSKQQSEDQFKYETTKDTLSDQLTEAKDRDEANQKRLEKA